MKQAEMVSVFEDTHGPLLKSGGDEAMWDQLSDPIHHKNALAEADVGYLWVNAPDFHKADFFASKGVSASSTPAAPRAVLQRFSAQNPAAAGVDSVSLMTGSNTESNNWLLEDGDLSRCGGSVIVLFPENRDHVLRRLKLHDAGGGPAYGTHGLYDKSPGTLCEEVESFLIQSGSALSPRYPNRYYKCLTHDVGPCYGIFDYSKDGTDGHGCTVVRIRESRAWNVRSWFVYLGPEHNGIAGRSEFGIEIDHCTLDLRGCANGPFAFQDVHHTPHVTNNLILWDGDPAALVLNPTDGTPVHWENNLVVKTADIPKVFSSLAPGFRLAANSLAIGKAGASSPECRKVWGDMPDLGAIQSRVVLPPTPTVDVPGALSADWAALRALQASDPYRTLKFNAVGLVKASWPTTKIYACEQNIIGAIKKLGG